MNDSDVETEAQNVLLRSYLVSLPERTARAGAALTGGLVYEASEVMLPFAVRRSKLYQAIVGRLLRITIELVGGVDGVYPIQEMPVRELLVRKTAGNVVELSSFLAARQEDRSILEISSTVALGAVRTGVSLGNVHLRLLPPRAADYRGGGFALLPAANQHPIPEADGFPFRSSVEHLLRTPAKTLGRPTLLLGCQTTPQTKASDEDNAARG